MCKVSEKILSKYYLPDFLQAYMVICQDTIRLMGISGINTPYQMSQAYSIYVMTYGQYYLLTIVCGYIASLLAASLSMLV